MKPPKIIVIGIDGASWDFLKPWIDEGELNTIKKLLEKSIWGTLESSIPPTTAETRL